MSRIIQKSPCFPQRLREPAGVAVVCVWDYHSYLLSPGPWVPDAHEILATSQPKMAPDVPSLVSPRRYIISTRHSDAHSVARRTHPGLQDYLPTEDDQQERVERTTVVCYKLPTKEMPKIYIGRNLGRTGASASRRIIELASRLQEISP